MIPKIFTYWTLFISILFSTERLRLKKANLLENKTINNESVKIISGDIIFSKGTLTLFCEEGRYYEKNDIALLYKNVSAIQEGRTVTCDTLQFFSKNDQISSKGNAHVWDKDYDLTSDSLIIFTKRDSGIAIGNVALKQKGQTIYANKIEYKKSSNKGGVSYVAIGDVVIKDSIRLATCERANYDIEDELTTLEKEPKIFQQNQTLSGKKIILKYEKDNLKEINIPKDAKAMTKIQGYKNIKKDSTDTLIVENNIEGSEMTGFVKNGELDLIRTSGMAKTLYHVFEDSIYKGKNNSSGDTIMMTFTKNSLNKINIMGGSEGEYIPDSLSNDITSRINYSSNQIEYKINQKKTNFIGNTNIKYEETNLEAGYISVDWETNILNALPKAKLDTLTNGLYPTIKEKGRDPMTGDEMIYNLKTKKGRIVKGNTKADDGFYTGNQIRNESKKILFIENSTYTTCDLDTAHFHFKSNKMKIIQNDIVIAKPIILHIAEIPLFGIPLGIFPHKGGTRHSGWIMPSYGDSKNRGQYIQGLGFYWAPSEYWDSKFTTGFGDKQGMTFKINTIYKVRYKFNGSINFFNRQYLNNTRDITLINEMKKVSTSMKWIHKHELRNNQSLNANITFSTNGNYNKNYGLTERERMDQKAISNLSYSKRWPKLKNSISLNFFSNKDLLIDDKINPSSRFYVQPNKAGNQLYIQNRTFPKFSFRHGQSDLFPSNALNKKWYNSINWNYNFNFNNQEKNYYESIKVDSSNFSWEPNNIKNKKDNVLIHSSRINAPLKLFKYIALNPSLNLKSAWIDKYKDGVWIDSTASFREIKKNKYAFRTTGSFSLNSNTQIYGIIPIPFSTIKAIRHVFSPSIGYSWTPDFSKPVFGKDLNYFSTGVDSTGEIYYFDKFKGSMAGGTPRTEQKSLNFSVNNIFQAKVLKDSVEKKIDFLSWRVNSNYNFAAEEFNLSNLRSSLRSKIANKLNLDLSLTHDFYDFNLQTNKRVNQLKKSPNGLIKPRLINAKLSTGFRISGNKWYDQKKTDNDDPDSTVLENLDDIEISNESNIGNKKMKNKQLWNTSFNLSYTYSANNPNNLMKNFWINSTSAIKITQNWKASYRARFDLIEKELVNHSIALYRDLHCWELSLNWTPSGYGQGINFKLNVKSPTLQDIKIEKKGGIYSGAGI